MYLGHALLAFTLVAFVAHGVGLKRTRAIGIGVLAGAFAFVPDIDTVYTAYVVIQAGPEQLFPTPKYVWTDESWVVHRALTHSLLVGATATGAVWLSAASARRLKYATWTRLGFGIASSGILGGLIWLGFSLDGWPGVATITLYLVFAGVLTGVALRYPFDPNHIAGAAAVGLLTHPFGDVFMGRPPIFIYPVGREPIFETVTLAPDATINLVGLVLLEVFLAWCAVWVLSRIQGWPIRTRIDPLALVGLGFALAVPVIRPPTLEVAYHFMFATIATGVVVGVGARFTRRGSQQSLGDFLITALAAVTLATLAYLGVYLVL